MRHACVPPRCGRMRVPEGLERGAGITRIAVTPMGHPRKLPEPLCDNASLGCKQIDQPCRRNATNPWRPSAMHRTQSFVKERLQPRPRNSGRASIHWYCRSVTVGLPLAARRSGHSGQWPLPVTPTASDPGARPRLGLVCPDRPRRPGLTFELLVLALATASPTRADWQHATGKCLYSAKCRAMRGWSCHTRARRALTLKKGARRE